MCEFPSPQNIPALKSYLGLLSYYSRFLPVDHTRHPVLATERWCTLAMDIRSSLAFDESKKLLQKSSLLVHFDPTLKIILACDASAYGFGAVQNYSQIDKEVLACVFGVQKFRSYLYGHHFTLQTDHKPLLTLFNETRQLHASIRPVPTLGPDTARPDIDLRPFWVR